MEMGRDMTRSPTATNVNTDASPAAHTGTEASDKIARPRRRIMVSLPGRRRPERTVPVTLTNPRTVAPYFWISITVW